jgi:integrase
MTLPRVRVKAGSRPGPSPLIQPAQASEGPGGGGPGPHQGPAGPDGTALRLFEAWCRERQPAGSTMRRWRGVFLAMDQFPPVLSKADAVAWKNSQLTANRSPRVVNEVWLVAARTVYGWAEANEMVASNWFKGVSVAVSKRPGQRREKELRETEWRTILRATLLPQDPQAAPWTVRLRRWDPWIMGYTGARGGEVTQLRAEDVVEVEGVGPCLRITPEAGTVKTGQARTIPLHSHLVEMGLVEVVKALGSGPIFYRAPGENRRASPRRGPNPRPPAVKAREALAAWVRSLGVGRSGHQSQPCVAPRLQEAMCQSGHRPDHSRRHRWARLEGHRGPVRGAPGPGHGRSDPSLPALPTRVSETGSRGPPGRGLRQPRRCGGED